MWFYFHSQQRYLRLLYQVAANIAGATFFAAKQVFKCLYFYIIHVSIEITFLLSPAAWALWRVACVAWARCDVDCTQWARTSHRARNQVRRCRHVDKHQRMKKKKKKKRILRRKVKLFLNHCFLFGFFVVVVFQRLITDYIQYHGWLAAEASALASWIPGECSNRNFQCRF